MTLPNVPNTEPHPSNPPSGQPPMEFPRPPNEPGRTDPRATPSPAQPSTLPPTGGSQKPGCSGVGVTNDEENLD
jgi:hypothetical protein